jgi:hypothetical protein
MGRRENERGAQRGIIGSRLLGRGADLGFGPPYDPVFLSVMKGWEAIHHLSWKAGFGESNLALRISQARQRLIST